jgi:choline dehydrogenase-like flavoprotein
MTFPTASPDIVIIGSGAGGGTMAYALKDSGARVLILERGGFLPREVENWSPYATITRSRYKPKDRWSDGRHTFVGSNHYFVGGMTKMFGACLARMRPSDFEAYDLEDGISPAWPIDYDELEPYYGQAERIWGVRGRADEDPMEPPRSEPFPHPALEHEPVVAELASRLREQGLHPYTLPMGVDLGAGGRCVRSKYCDGFSCPLHAKCDAEVRCVRPALESENVELVTDAFVERLRTDSSGRLVTEAEVRINGQLQSVKAGKFVICAGAANSAALLLRSANSNHQSGLANSSDQVGRNWIQHRDTAISSIDPRRRNTTIFQKTLGLNDFYLSPAGHHRRWGSLQTTGKVLPEHIRSVHRWLPRSVAASIAERSVDWWLMTEDCPLPENRMVLGPNGHIRLQWKPTSIKAHRKLVWATVKMMRRAGYPVSVWSHFGLDTNAHQASTMRFGTDPSNSILDPTCKAHDVDNLYAVDSGFLPSLGSGPGGPTLTVAAMALRAADKSDLLD